MNCLHSFVEVICRYNLSLYDVFKTCLYDVFKISMSLRCLLCLCKSCNIIFIFTSVKIYLFDRIIYMKSAKISVISIALCIYNLMRQHYEKNRNCRKLLITLTLLWFTAEFVYAKLSNTTMRISFLTSLTGQFIVKDFTFVENK